MGDVALRLPAVPETYNARDQAEMRRSLEAAIARLGSAPTSTAGLVFRPSDYLKRPDTPHWAALQAAIDDAVLASQTNMPAVPGAPGDAPTVDLEGRTWTLDEGVVMDRNTGITIQNGTLLASPTFATTDFLLTAGTLGAAFPDGFRINNLRVLNVTFRNDHRGGGFYLANYIRVRVTGCNFFGYSTIGLHLAIDGHECFLESAQFGEHTWQDAAGYNDPATYTGTGCQVDTNDNHITNVVIQLSRRGLYLTKTSNTIHQLHVWTGFKVVAGVVTNTQGIHLAQYAYYNTFTNCYIDTCEVLLENPWETTFIGCYFLHGQNVTSNAFIRMKALGASNYFHGIRLLGCTVRGIPIGGDPTMRFISFDETAGTFAYAQVTNCSIADNSYSGIAPQLSSRKRGAKSTQTGIPATTWNFDFADTFGFGVIRSVQVTSYQYAGPTPNAVFSVTHLGTSDVTVTASGPCEASVWVDVCVEADLEGTV